MKAMGNFTVDFNWSAGKCQAVRIKSHMGAPLKVRCAKGAMALKEACVKVNGAEVGFTIDENGIATIPCQKDDVVEIDFTTQGTGIASVGNGAEMNESAMFDLSGRRIKETPAGQVYIQNGTKKVAK
jgi:hypothetical protein